MRVTVIAAVAEGGVIGRDQGLPWRLSADLRRFKRLTSGHTLVMGRKTWESIGRPLPGRTSIVLTRQEDYPLPAGVSRAPSLEEALRLAVGAEEVFLIGGEALFKEGLSVADQVQLTRVEARVEGDAYFPLDGLAGYRLREREEHPSDAKNEYPYSFERYERIRREGSDQG